ncbi:hypothetical protein [Haloarchaeobius sp. DFWS5]|uniref:hypothetical protein n=1 Tax=Haloarchaeobius sp. DFWS5 TaxID=3446114 RepID=UPI003EBE6C36
MVSHASRGWAVAAGIVYGATAVGLVLALGIPSDDSFFGPLVVGAVLSALVIGGVSWYFLVERADENPVVYAGISGLLTGGFSHAGMWAVEAGWRTVTTGDLFHLLGWPFVIPLSLFTVGVITIPLAGLVGTLFGVSRMLVTRD